MILIVIVILIVILILTVTVTVRRTETPARRGACLSRRPEARGARPARASRVGAAGHRRRRGAAAHRSSEGVVQPSPVHGGDGPGGVWAASAPLPPAAVRPS